jgi:hypothetical protein
MQTKKQKTRLLLGGLVVFAAVFALTTFIKASTTDNVTGWLWGGSDTDSVQLSGDETGVGWVSMNSSYCDTNNDGKSEGAAGCPAALTAMADYGVKFPGSNGDLSGYAWSPNIGYITFNRAELTGCPSGTCAAYRVGNDIRGWARIVDIASAATAGNAGGWLGWISLNHLNCDTNNDGKSEGAVGCPALNTTVFGYGIVVNNDGSITKANNSAYAWSDELGYVDFSPANVPETNNLKICYGGCGLGGTPTSSVTMTVNDINPYVACYNTAADCTDPTGDVTNDPTTIWISSVPAKASVTKGAVANVKALAVGLTSISASYGGSTPSFTLTVNPLPVSCGSAKGGSYASAPTTNLCSDGSTPAVTASGSSWTWNCVSGINNPCTAGKISTSGWKEVAP